MSLNLVNIHGGIEGDYEIIKRLPDNATNGDVIKAMFPNVTIELIKSSVNVESPKVAVTWNFEPLPSYYNFFYKQWWDAPYNNPISD